MAPAEMWKRANAEPRPSDALARHRADGDIGDCAFTYQTLAGLSDEELVSHLDHRHADAIAILYQRYRRLVFAVAFRVLHDRGEAEDVVQNVFVDLYRTSLRFDPARGAAKVWILQFAYSRSLRRRQQLVSRHFYSAVDIAAVEDVLPAAGSATDRVENSQALSAALGELGGAQQQVIRLASEGHSLRDIADVIGETLPNVRHHYYRGLARLRTQLGVTSPTAARSRREAADTT